MSCANLRRINLYKMNKRTIMSETPIDIVINGLQTQISELKEIISGLNNASTAQVESIENERDSLKIENAKFNCRITHLLRTLDKKDYEISLLKKDLSKTRV